MLSLGRGNNVIVTGISGQDGAYLAKLLYNKGYKVYGTVREGLESNLYGLEYLRIKDKLSIIPIDMMDYKKVFRLLENVKPIEIYNLAAQSSVAVSFADPKETLQYNVKTVLYLLEAISKLDPGIRFYQASSSEMYGNANKLPINEETPLNPISPYAKSKAEAHLLVKEYREKYNLFAATGILFNHESVLRKDNFFVKKVIRDSILIKKGKKEYLEVGNIDVKRDFGYGPCYVEAMWKILQANIPDDYIICSGNSICLRDIILYVFDLLDIEESKIIINPQYYRPNDIQDIYGDNSKARQRLDWQYEMSFFEVLDILVREERLKM